MSTSAGILSIGVALDNASLNKALSQVSSAINDIKRQKINLTLDAGGFTQPLGRIKASASEFTKSLEAANARVVAFGASAGLIFQVEKAFSELIKTTVQVEKSLMDINVILGQSSEGLKKFGDELFNVARETGQSFFEVAKAATELSRQGLSAEETLKRTKDALVLTRLSGLDTASSVEALTAALNTFNNVGLSSEKIVNKLASVDAAFAVSSADLAEALKRVGSTAKDVGVDLDQLLGIVAATQQSTARGGAVIGNSLKSIFTRLQRTEVLDQLEGLGIAVRDLSGESMPAMQVLQNLAGVFGSLSKSQQAQTAETVAGVYQMNQLRAILGDLAKGYSVYESAVKISAKATNEASVRNSELNKTLDAQLKMTVANATQAAKKIGDLVFAPAIGNILGIVNTGLKDFNDKDSESAGGKIAEGIMSGIGKFLSGPGLALGLGLLGKLVANLGKFVGESGAQFLGLNTKALQQKSLQQDIQSILQRNPDLILQASNSTMGLINLQSKLLSLLKEESIIRVNIPKVSEQLAKRMIVGGTRVSGSGQVSSGGFIPNFNSSKEKRGAVAGGYMPGDVIRSPVGGVMNTAETVKYVPGFRQPFINPPEESKAGKSHRSESIRKTGVNPYSSAGFTPNFAMYGGKTGAQWGADIRMGRSTEQEAAAAGYKRQGEVRAENRAFKAENTIDVGKKIGILSLSGGNNDNATAVSSLESLAVGKALKKEFQAEKDLPIKFTGIQTRSVETLAKSGTVASQFSTLLDKHVLRAVANTVAEGPLAAILGNQGPKLSEIESKLGSKRLLPPGVEGSLFETAVNFSTKGSSSFLSSLGDDFRKPFDFEESGPANEQFRKAFGFDGALMKADAKRTGSAEDVRSLIKKSYNAHILNEEKFLELPHFNKIDREAAKKVLTGQKAYSGGFIPNFNPNTPKPRVGEVGEERELGRGSGRRAFLRYGEQGTATPADPYVVKTPHRTGERRPEAKDDAELQVESYRAYKKALAANNRFEPIEPKHVGGGVLKQAFAAGASFNTLLDKAGEVSVVGKPFIARGEPGRSARDSARYIIERYLRGLGLYVDRSGLGGNIIVPPENEAPVLESLKKLGEGGFDASVSGAKKGLPPKSFKIIDYAKGFIPNFAPSGEPFIPDPKTLAFLRMTKEGFKELPKADQEEVQEFQNSAGKRDLGPRDKRLKKIEKQAGSRQISTFVLDNAGNIYYDEKQRLHHVEVARQNRVQKYVRGYFTTPPPKVDFANGSHSPSDKEFKKITSNKKALEQKLIGKFSKPRTVGASTQFRDLRKAQYPDPDPDPESFSEGFVPNFSIIDDLAGNRIAFPNRGAILPQPDTALAKIVENQRNKINTNLDFDGTLVRTVGDNAYSRAKSPKEKEAVLKRYFLDHKARMDDIRSAPITQFGQTLSKGVNSGQVKPELLSVLTASDKSPGLPEFINGKWKIPLKNQHFGVKTGTKEKYAAGLAGGFVPNFGLAGEAGLAALKGLIPQLLGVDFVPDLNFTLADAKILADNLKRQTADFVKRFKKALGGRDVPPNLVKKLAKEKVYPTLALPPRASGGFVPNFNALEDSLGREMAAGYSSSQVRVGRDSRLDGGVGVYNSTEGSLGNAINMHLSSGKTIGDLQTQGAAKGFVPNFVDTVDTSMIMMGLTTLAFYLKDFANSAGKLAKGELEAAKIAQETAKKQLATNATETEKLKRTGIRTGPKAAAERTTELARLEEQRKALTSESVSATQNAIASQGKIDALKNRTFGEKAGGFIREKGMGLGLALQVGSGVLEQFVGDTETTSGRQNKAVVSGLGQVAGMAGTGAMVGGVPGAVVGGAIGGIMSIYQYIQAGKKTAEDYAKALDSATKSQKQALNSVTGYAQAQSNLNDLIARGAGEKVLGVATTDLIRKLQSTGDVGLMQKLIGAGSNINSIAEIQAEISESLNRKTEKGSIPGTLLKLKGAKDKDEKKGFRESIASAISNTSDSDSPIDLERVKKASMYATKDDGASFEGESQKKLALNAKDMSAKQIMDLLGIDENSANEFLALKEDEIKNTLDLLIVKETEKAQAKEAIKGYNQIAAASIKLTLAIRGISRAMNDVIAKSQIKFDSSRKITEAVESSMLSSTPMSGMERMDKESENLINKLNQEAEFERAKAARAFQAQQLTEYAGKDLSSSNPVGAQEEILNAFRNAIESGEDVNQDALMLSLHLNSAATDKLRDEFNGYNSTLQQNQLKLQENIRVQEIQNELSKLGLRTQERTRLVETGGLGTDEFSKAIEGIFATDKFGNLASKIGAERSKVSGYETLGKLGFNVETALREAKSASFAEESKSALNMLMGEENAAKLLGEGSADGMRSVLQKKGAANPDLVNQIINGLKAKEISKEENSIKADILEGESAIRKASINVLGINTDAVLSVALTNLDLAKANGELGKQINSLKDAILHKESTEKMIKLDKEITALETQKTTLEATKPKAPVQPIPLGGDGSLRAGLKNSSALQSFQKQAKDYSEKVTAYLRDEKPYNDKMLDLDSNISALKNEKENEAATAIGRPWQGPAAKPGQGPAAAAAAVKKQLEAAAAAKKELEAAQARSSTYKKQLNAFNEGQNAPAGTPNISPSFMPRFNQDRQERENELSTMIAGERLVSGAIGAQSAIESEVSKNYSIELGKLTKIIQTKGVTLEESNKAQTELNDLIKKGPQIMLNKSMEDLRNSISTANAQFKILSIGGAAVGIAMAEATLALKQAQIGALKAAAGLNSGVLGIAKQAQAVNEQSAIDAAKADFATGRSDASGIQSAENSQNLGRLRRGETNVMEAFGADSMSKIRADSANTKEQLLKDMIQIKEGMVDSFKTGFEAFAFEGKKAKDIGKDIVKSLMRNLMNMSFNFGVNSFFKQMMSGTIGAPSGFATGGKVGGGSGMRDDVPAMLTSGEYVIRKGAVNKYGEKFFEKLNTGAPVKFAEGGQVMMKSSSDASTALNSSSIEDATKKANLFKERDPRFDIGTNRGRTINLESDYAKNDLNVNVATQDKTFYGAGSMPSQGPGSTFGTSDSALSFAVANTFAYNDPERPYLGKFFVDQGLSNQALEDLDNPQNELKNKRYDLLQDYKGYIRDEVSNRQNAIEDYENQKQKMLDSAMINAAVAVASFAATEGAKMSMQNSAAAGEAPSALATAIASPGGQAVIGAAGSAAIAAGSGASGGQIALAAGAGGASAALGAYMNQYGVASDLNARANSGDPVLMRQAADDLEKMGLKEDANKIREGAKYAEGSRLDKAYTSAQRSSYSSSAGEAALSRLGNERANFYNENRDLYDDNGSFKQQKFNKYSLPKNTFGGFMGQGANPGASRYYMEKAGFKFTKTEKRALGGPMTGPQGTDKIPAMLTAGEYVVKKDSVDKYGMDFFDKLNRGAVNANVMGFANGGPVDGGDLFNRNSGGAAQSVAAPASSDEVAQNLMKLIDVAQNIQKTLEESDSSKGGNVDGAEVKSGGGQLITNNVTVTVNVSGGKEASSEVSSSSEGSNKKDEAVDPEQNEQFAEMLHGIVIKTIVEQQRPGGLLYN